MVAWLRRLFVFAFVVSMIGCLLSVGFVVVLFACSCAGKFDVIIVKLTFLTVQVDY